jgi:hypothetical protein
VAPAVTAQSVKVGVRSAKEKSNFGEMLYSWMDGRIVNCEWQTIKRTIQSPD